MPAKKSGKIVRWRYCVNQLKPEEQCLGGQNIYGEAWNLIQRLKRYNEERTKQIWNLVVEHKDVMSPYPGSRKSLSWEQSQFHTGASMTPICRIISLYSTLPQHFQDYSRWPSLAGTRSKENSNEYSQRHPKQRPSRSAFLFRNSRASNYG